MAYGGRRYGGAAYGGGLAEDIVAQTTPTLAVEVAFTTGALETPVWVDVTSDVLSWDTSRGRRRELERYQPGKATVVLLNNERQYDSSYSGGPYFGNLKPMRRIRIRETFNGVTYTAFDGFLDRIELDYPGTGAYSTATFQATDGFKLLARADLPRSVYFNETLGLDPVIYWTLDESKRNVSDDDLVANNAGTLGSTLDGPYVGPPELGGEPLVVKDPGGSIGIVNENQATGIGDQGILVEHETFDLLSNTAFTVAVWAIPRSEETTADTLWGTDISGSGPEFTCFYLGSGTRYEAIFFDNTGLGRTVQTAAGKTAAQRHFVVVTYNKPDFAIYLNGALEQTRSDVTGAVTSPGLDLHFGHGRLANENFASSMAHACIWTRALSAAEIADLYEAGTTPWDGDLPRGRAERILDLAQWPSSLREIDPGVTELQSAELDRSSALEHLQKLAETEFGLFFMAKAGEARLVDRGTQAVRQPYPVDFGDGAGEIGYRDIRFDDGDSVIRNRATVSRLGGVAKQASDSDSVDEFGPFDITLDGLLHKTDGYSAALAQFLVDEYHEPRRRVTELSLGPAAPGEASTLYPAMLGLELGDAVNVLNRPIGGGDPFEQTCVVEGIDNHGEPGGIREQRLILSPEFTEAPLFWQDYTPSNTNVTVGNGTQAARFARIGDTVFWSYILTFGSTTAFGGTVQIGLPVTARADVSVCGAVACYDASGNDFTGTATAVSSGAQVRPQTNGAGLTNATVPFTWANGDILVVGGSYEAA